MYTDLFSGKLIDVSQLPKREVQYGPLPPVKVPGPVDLLISSVTGKIQFVPEIGQSPLIPDKIEYLKS